MQDRVGLSLTPMFNRRLVKYARASYIALAATLGLNLLGGGLIVIQAWLMSAVIGRVFLDGKALGDETGLLGWLLGVMGLRAATIFGSEVSASRVAIKVKTELRRMVFEHVLALGPAYSQGERSGELSSTLVGGIESLDAYFSQYLPQLVIAALVPLTILLVVFPLDWLSAVVLLLTAPLIPVFMILIGKTTEALTRRQFDLLSRLSAHFLDVLQGLTTLKLLNQSRAQAKVIAKYSDQYRLATMNVLRVAFLSALVLEVVATISTAIVAVEVGLRVLYGQMPFQPALFILILAPEFYIPLRMLGLRFHAASSGVSAAKRVFEILDAPLPRTRLNGSGEYLAPQEARRETLPVLRLRSEEHRRSAQDAQGDNSPSVRFEAVSFAYGGRIPALTDVSVEILPGQKVALVGPSGAGKSTLMSLLLRFIEPGQGRIWVDDIDLTQIAVADWRERVAWVPQRPHLFHDTIAANIRLGRPEAPIEAVMEAARQAHLHEFVAALPLGYETVVGEQGARLSGGQAQRLALARAFLKDAPLLLLDEPTSAVDPDLEMQLQESTDRLMRGRSVLLIAHRLNTVYQADRIVVLEGGRVVETGRHAELCKGEGLYARMVGLRQSPDTGDPLRVLQQVQDASLGSVGLKGSI